MKVTDLRVEISKREGKKKEQNIADISETLRCLKDIILERSGLDLYKDIINNI